MTPAPVFRETIVVARPAATIPAVGTGAAVVQKSNQEDWKWR